MNPAAAAACLRCSFASDGGMSTTKRCAPDLVATSECVPGCTTDGWHGWCDPFAPSTRASHPGDACYGRPFRAGDLQHMMALHRHQPAPRTPNELILEPACWQRALPHAIEAVYYIGELSVARAVLVDFVHAFPRGSGRQTTPLVRLDLDDAVEPFKHDPEHDPTVG